MVVAVYVDEGDGAGVSVAEGLFAEVEIAFIPEDCVGPV